MTKFRGCVDIHCGIVKQIVGGTLCDGSPSNLKTNFVATQPTSYFADLYKKNNVTGCHVIMLGPGCNEAAESSLRVWPDGLQVGGGINGRNAKEWVEKGAEKV
jgi:phosphoribosylformimino-5-aminoimidazole carboxamide ribotide isomerase